MNRPPFVLDLRVPEAPYDGPFELRLIPEPEEPGETLEADDYQGAISLLELFVRAVRAQLLRADPYAAPVALDVERLSWDAATKTCVLRGSTQGLPAHAWLILAAALRKNHDALETLERISVTTAGSPPPLDDARLDRLLDRVLPDVDPPFEFAYGGIDARSPDIEFTFIDPIADTTYQALETGLNLWDELVLLGGFDLAFEEADDLGQLGGIKRASPIRASYQIPDYLGDISGFEALLCLAVDLHRRYQPLESLEIS